MLSYLPSLQELWLLGLRFNSRPTPNPKHLRFPRSGNRLVRFLFNVGRSLTSLPHAVDVDKVRDGFIALKTLKLSTVSAYKKSMDEIGMFLGLFSSIDVLHLHEIFIVDESPPPSLSFSHLKPLKRAAVRELVVNTINVQCVVPVLERVLTFSNMRAIRLTVNCDYDAIDLAWMLQRLMEAGASIVDLSLDLNSTWNSLYQLTLERDGEQAQYTRSKSWTQSLNRRCR